MIIPIICPKCGDILVNDFSFSSARKSCAKRINHKFSIDFKTDTNDISVITYKHNDKFIIYWDFLSKNIYIGPYIILKGRSLGATTSGRRFTNSISRIATTTIPWFEPDLSNFPQLINKIKTYILFS